MAMRYKYWLQLAAGVLLSASLLNSPAANAQRGARTYRAGTFISSRPASRPAPSRINSRRPSNFSGLGGTFPGTNLFPGGATGVNGINNVLIPRNLGVKAAIDPATQWNLALAERLGRNFPGSGFYLLGGGYGYAIPQDVPDTDQAGAPIQQQAQQQQPQIIVLQQPAAPVQQAAPQSSEQPVPVLPDVGQFTLILRNGTEIQAVAFTRMKDRIVYITTDGSRRTLAWTDLDSDATVRVNQERGTPLQLL
jgi:hypothetical protein